jgi:hypothetical protein
MEERTMPAVFLVDCKGGRTWEDILIAGFTESRLVSPTCGRINPAPEAGDVLVFHEELGTLKKAVEEMGKKGVWVVAVSEDGGDDADGSTGYYQRKRGVEKPTDDHFKACFRHFVERLKVTGKPEWQLLEGPPAPDALLAYHLLRLLPDEDNEIKEARKELRAPALDEAKTIADAAEFLGWTESDIDDREKLHDFLAKYT